MAEATDFRAPEGDYETIGGVVMQALGHIPDEGETVELTGFDTDAPIDEQPRWTATVVRDGRQTHRSDRPGARARPSRREDEA